MTAHHGHLSPSVVETIAGLTAGTVATLAVHPLDVTKTRLQIHRSTSSAPVNGVTILRSLLQRSHPLPTLYRGLTPNLIGNASSWALFFYFKSIVESQILPFRDRSPKHGGLTPGDFFLASGVSGILTTLSTNPIWVLKTRMLSSDRGTKGAYRNMYQGFLQVWRYEGIPGFYRGVGISLLGNLHGAVQFGLYEPLKTIWRRYSYSTALPGRLDNKFEKMGNTATILISGTAKIVAGTVTYPYQVVRSRLQTYDSERRFGDGVRSVVRGVWRESGWRGFYRGGGINVVRVLPSTWVTFLVYENVRFYLPLWSAGHRNKYEDE